jgi:hypothetical protein
MGSQPEGGVLDIHFGNKTKVDICRISLLEKNTSDHCKKQFGQITVDYLLGYDRLCEHHTYSSDGDLPGTITSALQLVVEKRLGRLHTDCAAPTSLKNQTGDISKLL